MPVVKTQDEIVARIEERKDGDLFGFEVHEYIGALDFEHARPYLKPETTAEAWAHDTAAMTDLDAAAEKYMTFAIGKASNHRSISATRSIMHYQAWLWMLGRDAEIDWENYAMYGAPILKQIAQVMGWSWPDDEAINRMANGEPCEVDCDGGCAD